MNIVVVGAGVGGLTAAILCARAGHSVTVIEKNREVGGKLWSYSNSGFTFDCGPSLLTLPAILKNVCGAEYEQEYRKLGVRPLEKICSYFWTDGTRIISQKSVSGFAEDIARNTTEPAERYLKYYADTERLFRHIAPLFLTGGIHGSDLVRRALFWKSLPHLPIRKSIISMHKHHCRYFSDEKVQQIFNRFATYVGSSPYRTAAVYSIISFIEHGVGAYYVPSGIRVIPQMLKRIAEKCGVRFVLNQRVERITTHGTSACAYTLSTPQRTFGCEALIANADILQMQMLLSNTRPLGYSITKRSTSAIVYLWGMNTTFERFMLHNIIFSDDYRLEFEDIFTHHRVPCDPTVYINISKKKAAGDAPPGMENWFVMVNVPAITTIDWEDVAQRMRRRIAEKISSVCGIDVLPHIVHEKILTPTTFAHTSCDMYGSLYGRNAHGVLGAFNRNPNYSRAHKNVYYCGGTVHPGGGIPLAILSGHIAASYCLRRHISFPMLEYSAIS